jgi:hypothetical protein
MKLNLGSGKDYRYGWINLDFHNTINKMDVSHDFNVFPYPLKDNHFNEIDARMILEHSKDVIRCLKELIRISKDNAIIRIIVPHATTYSNFTAFDHRANFTENSFDELILSEAGLSEMKLIKKDFIYVNNWKRFIPFKSFFKIFLNGIYDDLYFEFEVRKGETK